MQNLDNIQDFQAVGKGKTLESITSFPDQIRSAWEQVQQLSLPVTYKDITSILFSGMGGSAYAGRIIKSLYADKINIPVDIVTDYHLPAYVNERTLIILASYSGNTEEILSCCEEALKRNSYIIGITKGGLLAHRLKEANKPVFCFPDKYNPSLQPRMGQGYMITGQLAILSKLNLIKISRSEIIDLVLLLRKQQEMINPKIDTKKNDAKKIALAVKEKIIVLTAAEFLAGTLHAVQNSFHETGKHLAFYTILPETNHHLLEGLSFPEIIKKNLIFLFVNSDLYSKPIKTRLKLTREVVSQNGIETITHELQSPDKFSQVFELVQFGSFLTFYLAMLHDTDPIKIPYVTYFKNKLKEDNDEK